MPNVRSGEKTSVMFWVRKANKKRLKKAAADDGLTVTEYLQRLIDADIDKKKKGPKK